MSKLFDQFNSVLKEVVKGMTLSKSEIREMQLKEDLFVEFLKLVSEKPTKEDCERYQSITTRRMRGINDLLKCGYPLAHIKIYTIWGGK